MLSQGLIFISYRRDDSRAQTGRIYDHLESHFGHSRVFIDVDSIPLGVEFPQRLDQAVKLCQVFLAIIGSKWLEVTTDAGQRRIDSPADWVRLEIEAALRHGIPIIPVLVDGGTMPNADLLPGELKSLPRWQVSKVRHDPDFRRDMKKLIKGIETVLNERVPQPNPQKIDNTDYGLAIENIIWNTEITAKEPFHQSWIGNEILLKPPLSKIANTWLNSNKEKSTLLLSGNLLEETIKWSDKNAWTLGESENEFLIESILEEMDKSDRLLEREKTEVANYVKQNWLDISAKVKNFYTIFREILAWTRCQPFLTRIFFEVILEFEYEYEYDVSETEAERKVSFIAKKYFGEDTELETVSQHYLEIRSLVLDHEDYDSFWVLYTYREILKKRRIDYIYPEIEPSVKFLQEIGLIVNIQDELQVHNSIYQSIFNEEWVTRNVLLTRPYAQKFLSWLDSQGKDGTQLLDHREVEDAISWAQARGVILGIWENRFLAYSLES